MAGSLPRNARGGLLLALTVLIGGGEGCRPNVAKNPFSIDARVFAKQEPKLASKIARSPFTFFRYQNRAFVDAVCARYEKTIPSMPSVHLHGDAHVEQYAVAAEGRGLADFDASAIGPPVVDIARFATSLVLAYPDDERGPRAAIAALLRGYTRALDDPSAADREHEPAVATRIRARFEPTVEAWLDRVQQLISPMLVEEKRTYEALWPTIFSELRAADSALSPSFFQIKSGGRLDMGIGSARAQKFLIRVEGPTSAAADDLVMEAKAVEADALGSCMTGTGLDASRVIEGQAQLSNAPQLFLAVASVEGRQFYSHTWLVHYTELAVSDVSTAEELAELAEDVGLQLGRGHAKRRDGSQVPELRKELKRAADVYEGSLAQDAIELAGEVTRAWRAYRAELPPENRVR